MVFYGKSTVKVSCQGSGLHNYDLREIDAAKCNTAIHELTAEKIVKKYKSSHIHQNLCESTSKCEANCELLETINNFNLDLKNVHNADKTWLAVNKDI